MYLDTILLIEKPMSQIWIVENDALQLGSIRSKLGLAFPSFELIPVRTEHEFRELLCSHRAPNAVSLVVLDIFLPWSLPGPNIATPPDDIAREGFRAFERAGYRCVKLLAENDLTQGVPVVLYTQLDRPLVSRDLTELPESVQYFRKEAGHNALVDAINHALAGRGRREANWINRGD